MQGQKDLPLWSLRAAPASGCPGHLLRSLAQLAGQAPLAGEEGVEHGLHVTREDLAGPSSASPLRPGLDVQWIGRKRDPVSQRRLPGVGCVLDEERPGGRSGVDTLVVVDVLQPILASSQLRRPAAIDGPLDRELVLLVHYQLHRLDAFVWRLILEQVKPLDPNPLEGEPLREWVRDSVKKARVRRLFDVGMHNYLGLAVHVRLGTLEDCLHDALDELAQGLSGDAQPRHLAPGLQAERLLVYVEALSADDVAVAHHLRAHPLQRLVSPRDDVDLNVFAAWNSWVYPWKGRPLRHLLHDEEAARRINHLRLAWLRAARFHPLDDGYPELREVCVVREGD
mmetsp:Transcript_58340/g.131412  ORF Transcript_58340/g.131412 Transcript_58340/m.131412 type:complete len:339 (-) Transcript_58340:72-1088(-)